jgi:Family of unknown function (DUF6516)
MPGPRRTLGEYLSDRCEQLASLGGVLRDVTVHEFAVDDATIHAVVTFGEDDDRMLTAFEHIRLVDGRPHRVKYGYRCFHRGSFLFGYDRDPMRHPRMPHHKHVAGRDDRLPWDRVTLHDVVEELWSYESEDGDEAATR